jgi:hypothetical protein
VAYPHHGDKERQRAPGVLVPAVSAAASFFPCHAMTHDNPISFPGRPVRADGLSWQAYDRIKTALVSGDLILDIAAAEGVPLAIIFKIKSNLARARKRAKARGRHA